MDAVKPSFFHDSMNLAPKADAVSLLGAAR